MAGRFLGPIGKLQQGPSAVTGLLVKRAQVMAQYGIDTINRRGGKGQQVVSSQLGDGSTLRVAVIMQIPGQAPLVRTWVDAPSGQQDSRRTLSVMGGVVIEGVFTDGIDFVDLAYTDRLLLKKHPSARRAVLSRTAAFFNTAFNSGFSSDHYPQPDLFYDYYGYGLNDFHRHYSLGTATFAAYYDAYGTPYNGLTLVLGGLIAVYGLDPDWEAEIRAWPALYGDSLYIATATPYGATEIDLYSIPLSSLPCTYTDMLAYHKTSLAIPDPQDPPFGSPRLFDILTLEWKAKEREFVFLVSSGGYRFVNEENSIVYAAPNDYTTTHCDDYSEQFFEANAFVIKLQEQDSGIALVIASQHKSFCVVDKNALIWRETSHVVETRDRPHWDQIGTDIYSVTSTATQPALNITLQPLITAAGYDDKDNVYVVAEQATISVAAAEAHSFGYRSDVYTGTSYTKSTESESSGPIHSSGSVVVNQFSLVGSPPTLTVFNYEFILVGEDFYQTKIANQGAHLADSRDRIRAKALQTADFSMDNVNGRVIANLTDVVRRNETYVYSTEYHSYESYEPSLSRDVGSAPKPLTQTSDTITPWNLFLSEKPPITSRREERAKYNYSVFYGHQYYPNNYINQGATGIVAHKHVVKQGSLFTYLVNKKGPVYTPNAHILQSTDGGVTEVPSQDTVPDYLYNY